MKKLLGRLLGKGVSAVRPTCTAILAAAGSSQRMGGENKLLLPLDGMPDAELLSGILKPCYVDGTLYSIVGAFALDPLFGPAEKLGASLETSVEDVLLGAVPDVSFFWGGEDLLSVYCRHAAEQYLDYDTQTASFESEKFLNILTACAAISSAAPAPDSIMQQPMHSAAMYRTMQGQWYQQSGGAFCAGYYEKNISRVMTNFAGSASDVSTLAHELGHAFNNRMLRHKPLMMNDTPMPLAETASTFNETLLIAQLLKDATPEEELTLLDSCLVEQTQTMVDIYSRFLFEQKVVAAQADHALDVDELKETMLWAQDQSYGDGLDPAFRHPYMWACKSHYYSPNVHFYNFPYAFGGLFARGLYARYEQEGEAFVPVYCDLLSRFGSDTIANVTASVGIDVTTPDFWRSAVESVLVQVRRFVELANQETAAK